MIRITIERHHLNSFPKTIVKEFADDAAAANWFIQDSYFAEPYTTKATWERVPESAQVTMFYTFPLGNKRRDRYVKITAESAEHCRAIMLNHFGRDWAFDYPSAEKARVDEFELIEIPRDEWPPSTCEYEVNTFTGGVSFKG